MELSIITATRKRPQSLAHCLRQVREQSVDGIRFEHIVVADEPDQRTRQLCQDAGVSYHELAEPGGAYGAVAKDYGLSVAQGQYCCFWDDDNIYSSHALAALFASAYGVDIGVVRTKHHLRSGSTVILPRTWNGSFQFGDIDTMCVCVRTDLARVEVWGDGNPEGGTDYRWLAKLERHEPKIRYVPVVIGEHL